MRPRESRVGPYEIIGALGSGGMGEVYRARDAKLERDIALKILPPELASNPEALRRFEQEARAASALNHPNIVTIYEINREDAVAWIAMELVDGEDLRTLCEREPLPLKNALRVASKIADGLAAAHERGIVHRDLKPDNIMISRDDFVKILDFGLAKQLRILAPDDATVPHTAPGAVFGTVGYMSPEQARGREMDYRSDQFSFGVMLYELLTRVRPFEKETKPETMTAILRDEPPPPSELNEEVPRELDRVVMRCLAKQPRDRYGSTRDLAHDLRELRDSITHPSNRSAPPMSFAPRKRTRRPRALALAAIALIALLAVGVLGWRTWSRGRSAARIDAVAVMPFRDLTGSAEGRMLADGISEMVATRLGGVRELRVAPPFDGVPIAESDDVRAAAKRKGVQAVIRGTVQRGGSEVRVTYSLVDAASGNTLRSTSVTRAATELFALEDAIADDLLRTLGRAAPPRKETAIAVLGPEDQRRFVEAVGLLQRVKDEEAVDRAIATLESLLGNARESGAVNALLARALLYKSSLARRPALVEQAMVYATRGVTLSPDDAEAQVTLGEVHLASGRNGEALAAFEKGLALRPDDSTAITGLAQAYHGLGRAADADANFRRAVALRPDGIGTFMKYGAFCYERGRYDEAIAHFRRVTDLDGGFSSAYSNLGMALQARGRYEEALSALAKSLAIAPTAPGYSNLGTLQFSLGRFGDAERSYERAAEIAPSDFVLWANLGDARRWSPVSRGRAPDAYRRAVDAARRTLDVKPNDAYTRASLALCLAYSGDATAARIEIRRALDADPTHPLVLYKAALIATLDGNEDAAISWVERAVKAGYSRESLARDPELAPLKDSPAFLNAVKSPKSES